MLLGGNLRHLGLYAHGHAGGLFDEEIELDEGGGGHVFAVFYGTLPGGYHGRYLLFGLLDGHILTLRKLRDEALRDIVVRGEHLARGDEGEAVFQQLGPYRNVDECLERVEEEARGARAAYQGVYGCAVRMVDWQT